MSKKIRILPNGPYEVSNDVPLVNTKIVIDGEGTSMSWANGKEFPELSSRPYHLCRCGHSSKKPYCDGEHAKIGFKGVESAPKGRDVANTRIYEGAEIDLMDEESLCAQLRFCDRGPRVWNAAIESDKPGYKELAIEECAGCAAGRLTPITKDGTPIEPELNQEISPITDTYRGWRGPLWVKGGIEMIGADGEPYMVRNRMTLCRCGESRNMPFCDISHLGCKHMQGSDE